MPSFFFPGFEPCTAIAVPAGVFSALFTRIHNIAEFKVVLYAVYRAYAAGQMQCRISCGDFISGAVVTDAAGNTIVLDRGAGLIPSLVKNGLERAVAEGFLARHDICPDCRSELPDADSSQGTADLPERCPVCGTRLRGETGACFSLRFQDPGDASPQAFYLRPEVASYARTAAASSGRGDHAQRAQTPRSSAPGVRQVSPAGSPARVRTTSPVARTATPARHLYTRTSPPSRPLNYLQPTFEEEPDPPDDGRGPAALQQCDVTLGDGRTVPLPQAWSLICENLKGQLSRDAFDTTFRLATVGWDGEELALDFPSVHMAEAVSETYYYALDRATVYVFGQKIPIQISYQMERS
jgi:hypothetical protein